VADTDARDRKIAVLLGAGMSDRQVAAKLGLERTTVGKIRRRKVDVNEELRRIRDEARAKVAPRAIALVEKSLDKIDAALDGVEVVVGKGKDGEPITKVLPPPLSHQASALRELAALSGLTRDDLQSRAPQAPGGLAIPMTAEAVAALVQAVRNFEAEQRQPKDITVDGERIE
jgi:transcriptional regulator with XRE-family HTH domain